jgi:hypothetical protein
MGDLITPSDTHTHREESQGRELVTAHIVQIGHFLLGNRFTLQYVEVRLISPSRISQGICVFAGQYAMNF